MTTISYGREAVHNQGFNIGSGLFGRVKSYMARSRAARQLAQLDDRLLADIGVKRSDITSVIWGN